MPIPEGPVAAITQTKHLKQINEKIAYEDKFVDHRQLQYAHTHETLVAKRCVDYH